MSEHPDGSRQWFMYYCQEDGLGTIIFVAEYAITITIQEPEFAHHLYLSRAKMVAMQLFAQPNTTGQWTLVGSFYKYTPNAVQGEKGAVLDPSFIMLSEQCLPMGDDQ